MSVSAFLKGASKVLFHDADVDRADFLSKKHEMSVDEIAENMRLSTDEVIELLQEALARTPKPIDLFVVWDKGSVAWNGHPYIKSMHQTIKGALDTIPDTPKKKRIIQEQRVRLETEEYVYDFGDLAIEKRALGA
jgi:hypothetical protein